MYCTVHLKNKMLLSSVLFASMLEQHPALALTQRPFPILFKCHCQTVRALGIITHQCKAL